MGTTLKSGSICRRPVIRGSPLERKEDPGNPENGDGGQRMTEDDGTRLANIQDVSSQLGSENWKLHDLTMRHFLWLLFFEGFWCYENPLKISPNSLVAWTGSCVLIPCQIEERLNSKKIVATSVIWYFQPNLNMTLFDYVGNVLYNNSRIPNEEANLPSPDFQGRVRFVGDLSKGNCSLMITQLQKKDNGTYGVKVAASVENQAYQQILYTSATLNVSGKNLAECF